MYITLLTDCVISDLSLKYPEVYLWNWLNGDLTGSRRIKISDLSSDLIKSEMLVTYILYRPARFNLIPI